MEGNLTTMGEVEETSTSTSTSKIEKPTNDEVGHESILSLHA
uniref:Uncharacterized protein n=1 Tax=Vitis vinifera TaxID=29760 RepID=F6HT75_VITVI